MNKGGVGKTTLCTNLAAILSDKKKRTLLIDTDAQCNCSLAFGLAPPDNDKTIYRVLLGDVTLDDAAQQITKNLSLVPSSTEMNWLDFDILTNPGAYPQPFNLLKPQLDLVKDRYDYILIDTPPSFGLIVGNVLFASDKVLIPTEADAFSIQGIIRVIDAIERFKKSNRPKLEIAGIIPMRVERSTNLHSGVLDSLQKYCWTNDINIFNTIIPKTIKFSESVATHGKPAIWVEKRNPLVNTYLKLAKEVF